ncbi:MAG: NAD(P)/FAD-dependent oxidoreductase [Bacteroidetes bacterium]|nr:NAD(P)/FAD-dependent oxidoreductase [Bacteroidota bacterium]
MSVKEFDLVIVGAGPAGCTTALCLSDSGLKVAMVDKADLPAEKVCGDALSGTVLNVIRRLPGNCFDEFLKLEPKMPSWGIRFAAPDGNLLDVPFVLQKNAETPPPGYLCRRKVFDGFLQQKVRELTSAQVISNFQVNQILRENDSFILKGESGELKCRMIAGADGTHSTVGRLLTGNPLNRRQYCLGARAYFTGVRDLHPDNFIELHFLEELLPGYLWIFPMPDGIANVGLGVLFNKMKLSPETLPARLQRMISTHPALAKRFEGAVMKGKIEAQGLPLGPDTKAISGNGFLLAGDAASLVDPFSGEGIGNAMVSGEIAAGVIREAFATNDLSAGKLKQYDERIKKRMGKELRTSRRIQTLCSYPSLFNAVVKKANRNKELKQLFTRMYTSQDVRNQLINPGFYLKILLG